MNVRWSRALAQAEEIFEYIPRDRPESALDVLEGLIKRVDLLRELPEQGRVLPGSQRGDLPSIIHGSHRIVYRVHPDEIAVLSVRHTRQP